MYSAAHPDDLRMVYLVGVDHLIQYNGPVPETLRLEFREYLITTARSLGISCIAEEFNREALHNVYHATEATAQQAAQLLGIEHRFCDPGENEMRELGIPYYQDIVDRVKKRRGMCGGFILDDSLRNEVEHEAAETARAYWRLREDFWFARVADIITADILFVCGHEHADRFMQLIIGKGHRSFVLVSFWREEIFMDYSAMGLA